MKYGVAVTIIQTVYIEVKDDCKSKAKTNVVVKTIKPSMCVTIVLILTTFIQILLTFRR